ncbi:hypothetical protein HO133_011059 [Letharia lupina]|uniref:Uncharacterized protein n=1 Tax=Letharia lupina TaxID=560253 RepID=A0A8H6FDH2_9LECA|nr:uncharacterized protein HO133_011059 [Letharia lupina]KAF6224482.1 hypothetical protein HO133_011059 [Letharia lupina]
MASKVIIVIGELPEGISLVVCEYLLQKPQSARLAVVGRGKQQLEDIKSPIASARRRPFRFLARKTISRPSIVKTGQIGCYVLNPGVWDRGAAISQHLERCSKAAIDHLATEVSIEEPEATTVSVKPGVVNTEMQKQVAIQTCRRTGPQRCGAIHEPSRERCFAPAISARKCFGEIGLRLVRKDRVGKA